MRVGIEVGGTFTDLVAVDGDEVRVVKVPSNRLNPEIGAFNALRAAGIDLRDVRELVHGSTVATNAILERRGAKVAFVTTEGFRDLLFLQRHDRKSIYDLRYAKPEPPVRRKDCYEVAERIGPDGAVIRALDMDRAKRELLPRLAAGGYEAIAICLLSSYASPSHELALRAAISESLSDVSVSCSHEISCEFREFERASTAALSAYVQPVIDSYLRRLEATLLEHGFTGSFSVMQSNGGRLPARAMRRNAITALFSGPAAGVVGAIRQASRSQRSDLITFDMGGTSTDVSLVRGGRPDVTPETEIDGLPVRTPILDIATVGAGGGSIVWIDDGGMLRVGPESAGAEPGPACYGRGGTRPTVTDAHVVRGTIRPEGFLGGEMHLDAAAARRAFEPIAARLGIDVQAAAAASIRLAVANIVRAIQNVSTERGRDPREYSLLPFGGAGPLLAAEVAEELGSSEVIVPPSPGVTSALGLLSSDYAKVYALTRRARLDDRAPAMIAAEFRRLEAAAIAEFRSLGVEGALDIDLEADMRFVGQAFEVAVPIDPATLPALESKHLAAHFDDAHQRVYHHGGEPGREIEIVAIRVTARRKLAVIPAIREREAAVVRPPSTTVVGGGASLPTSVVDAATVKPGLTIEGPALVEGYSSAIWIPVGWTARCDEAGNTLLRKAH